MALPYASDWQLTHYAAQDWPSTHNIHAFATGILGCTMTSLLPFICPYCVV